MIELSEMQSEWLKRRAFQSAPLEACGFLMESGKFVEINNSHPYPHRGFKMAYGDLRKRIADEEVSQIIAMWHTHPGGSLNPSPADMDYMYVSKSEWSYIIATKADVRVWPPNFFAPQQQSFWGAFSQ